MILSYFLFKAEQSYLMRWCKSFVKGPQKALIKTWACSEWEPAYRVCKERFKAFVPTPRLLNPIKRATLQAVCVLPFPWAFIYRRSLAADPDKATKKYTASDGTEFAAQRQREWLLFWQKGMKPFIAEAEKENSWGNSGCCRYRKPKDSTILI